MGQSWPLFVYFRPFLITILIIEIEKILDGVLGMVGADKEAALGLLPYAVALIQYSSKCQFMMSSFLLTITSNSDLSRI